MRGMPLSVDFTGYRDFTPTSVKAAGTILHGSKLALTVWFWAAYLMATHSNGIAALRRNFLQRLAARRQVKCINHPVARNSSSLT